MTDSSYWEGPTGLGLSVFQERYARDAKETWDEACHRVARFAASAEEHPTYWEDEFYQSLRGGFFMPGGRIWYGAGRPLAQAINCYVLPTSDSREGWGKSISDMLVTSGMGGGVGANFSPIRGRGYAVGRMGGHSTGAVSLMHMWNAVGDQLVAGGGRRLALMLCLNFDHPDIEEFIDSKLNLGKLNNANISIVIPADYDASDFVKAVEDGAEIPLRFNGRPDHEGRTINARLLWDRIVDNASTSGEPGVLNAHLANKESNVWYSHPLISTNPCGEQWLPGYGCCDLGAIVLPRHVRNGRVDWGSLRQTIDIGVRFLDNILTVNDYPLPEMQQMAQDERRIGLGVMGLHSMMLDCGVQYGTREGLNFIDSLFRFIKEEAYVSSTDLAGEKGAFPLYDPALLESGFMQRMEPEVRSLIETKGLRNCCLLTVAPTGTTAIVQNVTSGIEPMFSPVYYRRRFVPMKNGKKRIHRTLVISKDYTDHLFLAEGAYDIPPESHFEVQKLVQSHVDSAVSKTINIPKAFPKDKLAALWLRYLPSVKGTTLYREGSRAEEPLEYIPTKDLPKILSNWTGDIENEDGSKSIDPCVWGVCDV